MSRRVSAGWLRAVRLVVRLMSQVACGVGTRPGDEDAVRVATSGGAVEGWPVMARTLSPLEPARQRGLEIGCEVSGVAAELGGVRGWHATWR